MSNLSRHKKPDAFYKLVQFIETLDEEKRKKILNFMREEDPIFVQNVEKYVFHWEEFENINDMIICEIVSELKDMNVLALSLYKCPNEKIVKKFTANIPPQKQIAFKQASEFLDKVTVRQQNSSRITIIETARKLEGLGKIQLKACPKTYEG
jgi:flagellar motor switch protein FliG